MDKEHGQRNRHTAVQCKYAVAQNNDLGLQKLHPQDPSRGFLSAWSQECFYIPIGGSCQRSFSATGSLQCCYNTVSNEFRQTA